MATPIDILIRARDEFSAVVSKAESQINALAKSNVELGNATVKVSSEASKASGAFDSLTTGVKKTHQSFIETRESARAVGELIGVTLPGYVTSFLARSSLIGPALESAFSTLAVVGLIGVVLELPDAFKKVEESLTGFGEKEKKVYEKLLEDNQKAVDRVRDLAVELAKVSGGPIAGTNVGIASLEAERNRDQARASLLRTQASGLAGFILPNPIADVALRKAGEQFGFLRNNEGKTADELNKEAADLEDKAAKIAEAIRKLQGTAQVQTAEAAKKAGEDFAKLQDESEKFAEEQKLFWERASSDLSNTVSNFIAKAAQENVQGAKDNLKDWQETLKLEQELGDAFLKRQEFLAKEFQDFRSSEHNAIDIKGGESEGERLSKAIIKNFDEAKKRGQEIIKGITDDIGRMFTDSIVHGKNFWDAFKRLGLDAIAAVTNALVKGLATQGLNSLLGGVLGHSSGLAKLLGLGGTVIAGASTAAAATTAGAFTSIGGTTLLNTGFAANSAVAAPAAFGGGIGGALGLGGGAGLFGLGAATIPVIGAIALGIFGLSKLFGHHTQEAPFTRDPNVSQERTYFFYAANEMADASRELAGATKQLKGINPNDVVVKGLPGALQQSNQFRRNINGVLQDDI